MDVNNSLRVTLMISDCAENSKTSCNFVWGGGGTKHINKKFNETL